MCFDHWSDWSECQNVWFCSFLWLSHWCGGLVIFCCKIKWQSCSGWRWPSNGWLHYRERDSWPAREGSMYRLQGTQRGQHIPSPAKSSPSRTEVNRQIKTFPFPHFAHLFSTRSAIIKWWPGVRAYVLAAIINQCWTTRYYMFPFVKTGDSVIIQSNMTEHFPSRHTGIQWIVDTSGAIRHSLSSNEAKCCWSGVGWVLSCSPALHVKKIEFSSRSDIVRIECW